MAEALLSHRLPNVQINSAGLAALTGYPADAHAIGLLGETGIDITKHRAQQLTGLICGQADLILVMEHEHKQVIEQRYPVTRGKLFTLGLYGKFDVLDPYRQNREKFVECLTLIERGVTDWVSRINALS